MYDLSKQANTKHKCKHKPHDWIAYKVFTYNYKYFFLK